MKVLNRSTELGDLDLAFEPAAFGGYDKLAQHAVTVAIAGTAVASLGDVTRAKEAADRPKHCSTLPVLYGLRDEIAELRKGTARSHYDSDS